MPRWIPLVIERTWDPPMTRSAAVYVCGARGPSRVAWRGHRHSEQTEDCLDGWGSDRKEEFEHLRSGVTEQLERHHRSIAETLTPVSRWTSNFRSSASRRAGGAGSLPATSWSCLVDRVTTQKFSEV